MTEFKSPDPMLTVDLPTIVFETRSGARRRIRYERGENAPHRVERHVDRWDADEEAWVPVGVEELADLRVNGETRAAVALTTEAESS